VRASKPFVPPRLGSRQRAREPYYFTPLPGTAPGFRAGLKLAPLDSKVPEAAKRKKDDCRAVAGKFAEVPMHWRRPLIPTQPHSRRSADIQARSRYFTLAFSLETGQLLVCARTFGSVPTRSAWRLRSPESGIAVSTDAKTLSREKRKVWLIFSYPRLSVVVPFPRHHTGFNTFCTASPRAKLHPLNSK